MGGGKHLQVSLNAATGRNGFVKSRSSTVQRSDLYQDRTREYLLFRDWVRRSLDCVRDELWPMVWVVFVYSVKKLVDENNPREASTFVTEFADDFREYRAHDLALLQDNLKPDSQYFIRLTKSRFSISMSTYSQELIENFFHNNDMKWYYSILNEYVTCANPRNVTMPLPHASCLSKPLLNVRDTETESSIITGESAENLKAISNKNVTWSVPVYLKSVMGGFTGASAYAEFYSKIPRDFLSEEDRMSDDEDDEKPDADIEQQFRVSKETKLDRHNERIKQEELARKEKARLENLKQTVVVKTEPPRNAIIPKSLYANALERLTREAAIESHDIEDMVNKSAPERARKQLVRMARGMGKLTQSRIAGTITWPTIAFQTFFNCRDSFICADVDRESRIFVAGFSDSRVRIWYHPLVWKQINTEQGVSQSQSSIDDMGMIQPGTENPTPQPQEEPNVVAKEPLSEELCGHSGPVYACSLSPSCHHLLSASQDGTIRLWMKFDDLALMANINNSEDDPMDGSNLGKRKARADASRAWRNVYVFDCGGSPVWDAKFAPCGNFFASGSEDGYVRLWSIEKKRRIGIFAGHLSSVECVEWHPNAHYIASGSADKTVRLWDVLNGECMRVFCGHLSSIQALAFTSTGRYIVSGGNDKLVIVWDIAHACRVAVLEGHSAPVWSISVSQDCLLIASGGADGSVRVWDAFPIWGRTTEEHLIVDPKAQPKVNEQVQCKSFPTKYTPVNLVRFQNERMIIASGSFALPTM